MDGFWEDSEIPKLLGFCPKALPAAAEAPVTFFVLGSLALA